MSEKNKLPTVSIIIPTYNRSRLLRLAVESVLAQTYPAIELIVVDDGSTDDTPAVMAEYAGRIIYLRHEENQGRDGVKKGLQVASGHYINILDHDDLFMPTKIERQVQVLESQPEIGLVHCWYYHIDENGNIIEKLYNLPEGNVLKELIHWCFLWSGGPLMRRHIIDQVGLPSAYCGDWEMWLRIALAGYKFACIPEALGSYRIMTQSQMSNVSLIEQGMLNVLKMVFADPRLPTELISSKDHAYSDSYFEFTCRYYATGHWDDGQRCLTKALTLRPELMAQPEKVLQRLYFGALDIRTSNPLQFANDIFEYLPAVAEFLRPYHSQLLSRVYAGLALRNYGFGHISQAQQQLAEAFALSPEWQEEPKELQELIYNNALAPHIDDPINLMTRIFDHLPAAAKSLHSHRSHLFSQIYLDLALQSYDAGNISEARRQLSETVALNPDLLKQTKEFQRLLTHYAVNRAGSLPLAYIETVFQNLPENAQPLAQIRSYVISEVNIACAFKDYTAGRRRSAARQVLTGLRHHPAWLKNKGVVAVLVKSLPDLLIRKRSLQTKKV